MGGRKRKVQGREGGRLEMQREREGSEWRSKRGNGEREDAAQNENANKVARREAGSLCEEAGVGQGRGCAPQSLLDFLFLFFLFFVCVC